MVEITGVVGGVVNFTCRSSGPVEFRRDGEHGKLFTYNNRIVEDNSLIIKDLVSADSGIYKCYDATEGGMPITQAKISVMPKGNFFIILHER